MHKSDLIKLTSLTGTANINGTDRTVHFEPPGTPASPSQFIIEGLKVEDVYQILEQLNGGLLKGKDAENPTTSASAPIDFAKKAKELKAAKDKPAEQLSLPKVDTKPPPAVETKAAPEPEPESDEDDDIGDDDDVAATDELDTVAMTKMDKLRDVIEYMISKGHNTSDKIVAIASKYKDAVPLLKKVDEKGGFEKRMERNALVVLSSASN